MDNIIEKLGIKPIKTYFQKSNGAFLLHKDGNWMSADVGRKLEQQCNEMLEALIEDILEAEINWVENWQESFDNNPNKTDDEIRYECHKANADKIEIIEKTIGKTLEEIKELLNA